MDNVAYKAMSILTEDLQLYRIRVRDARVNRSEELIYNDSHNHAAVLIEELFLAADSKVGILCHDLSPSVYGSERVLAAAKAFLGRPGAILSIATEKVIDASHPLLLEAEGDGSNSAIVRCKLRPPAFAGIKFNFMVADQLGYRFEGDSNLPNAIACFNDPGVATKMQDLISLMFSDLDPDALAAEVVSAQE